jgi:hypothetical protein
MFYSILYFYISLQIIKTLEKYSTNFQVNNNINDELNVLLQYIFFKSKLYAFNEYKIYLIKEYENTEITSLIELENVFYIYSHSSNILNINNEYIAIGGSDSKNFVIFTLNGKSILNHSLHKFTNMNYPTNLIYGHKNYIVLSYISSNFQGRLVFYNYKNGILKEFENDIEWNNRFINYDCKFFYAVDNILCIFSPDSNIIYYEIYSIFGRVNTTQILYINVSSKRNYIRTHFIILKDTNDIYNIYSDIIIASIDSSYTLNLFYFQSILIKKKIVQIEQKSSIKYDYAYSFSDLVKISEKLFLVVVNGQKMLFYSYNLFYLGISNNNTITSDKYNSFFPFYKNTKKNLLITSLFYENDKKVYSNFYEFEFAYCKDYYITINENNSFNLTLEPLLVSKDENLTVYIKFPDIPNLKNDIFSFTYYKNNDIQNIINEDYYDLNTNFSIFVNSGSQIKIGYVFLEALNETLMIPSELCYIHIN